MIEYNQLLTKQQISIVKRLDLVNNIKLTKERSGRTFTSLYILFANSLTNYNHNSLIVTNSLVTIKIEINSFLEKTKLMDCISIRNKNEYKFANNSTISILGENNIDFDRLLFNHYNIVYITVNKDPNTVLCEKLSLRLKNNSSKVIIET